MMAIGKVSPDIKIEKVSLKIGPTSIFRNGEIVKNYKESDVKEHMKNREILIHVDMRSGKNNFSVYTCDLTKEYISINADYRS